MQGETFPEGHIAISDFFFFLFFDHKLASQHRARSKGSRGHELNPPKPVTKYFLLFLFPEHFYSFVCLLFVYVWLFCLHIHLCIKCMQCRWRPEEGVRFSQWVLKTFVSRHISTRNGSWVLRNPESFLPWNRLSPVLSGWKWINTRAASQWCWGQVSQPPHVFILHPSPVSNSSPRWGAVMKLCGDK